MPPVTKLFGTLGLLFNLGILFKVLHTGIAYWGQTEFRTIVLGKFVLDFSEIVNNNEYWRLATSFLYFGFGHDAPAPGSPIRILFVIIQFHKYLMQLENGYFVLVFYQGPL